MVRADRSAKHDARIPWQRMGVAAVST